MLCQFKNGRREQHAGHVVERMIEEDGVAEVNTRKPARHAPAGRNVQMSIARPESPEARSA